MTDRVPLSLILLLLATLPACNGEGDGEPAPPVTVSDPAQSPAAADPVVAPETQSQPHPVTPQAERAEHRDDATGHQPVPAAAPVAMVTPPPADSMEQGDACPVTLNRATLASGVQNREPVGSASTFPARGDRVFVFMEVNNPSGPEREMTIRWNHLASDHRFEQTIPAGVSPSWRTWVYHTIWPELSGDWEVEILAPGACRVGELTFRAT